MQMITQNKKKYGVSILDNDDIQERLLEALENLDKVADDLVKTMNKMLSYSSLMLIVLLVIAVVAILF